MVSDCRGVGAVKMSLTLTDISKFTVDREVPENEKAILLNL